ncbi:MAG: 1-deoxy-D-xylulose-5-phosphate synthase [Candidatus Omnitrophota bacterium]|jgi:1-deoxy-D-xylulose-5-phosphate synthase
MFLEKIDSPRDLRKIKNEDLAKLSSEIRQKIIEAVSLNGGHLASSLGAVELIIALHYCLNTPEDKIIFDVGHQAYAHKIITGRAGNFSTLRRYEGLSGFPLKEESEFDVFTTGHSSSAVSLALGLVCARDNLSLARPFKVVAVVGDGSLSGGLCFEGLNNAGHLKKDILVILNTNELSIAPNVGAISNYLNKIISLPVYNRFRESLVNFLSSRGPRAERLLKLASRFEEGLKGLFIPGVLFEELGFRYFGPLDGHNLDLLIPALKNILNIKGPRILHVVTKKGKGYFAAERDPVRFHGTGPFDIQAGTAVTKPGVKKSYTEVFGEKLLELAGRDNKIVAVTAAMPEGTGLDKFRDSFPERFFDVGIAESHAVTFSAGLAKGGLKPVVVLYSTFLQRAYDQIIEDVALQNLPVVFCIDRAGIVGEDGVTHQGIFDISFLNTVPDLVSMAPKDGEELKAMLEFALYLNKPVAIRYPRGEINSFPGGRAAPKIELGKPEILRSGDDFAVIALGSMVAPSLEAAELLRKEGHLGSVINARFSRPLDKKLLEEMGKKFKFIFTAEEGIIDSGFGCALEGLISKPVIKIGLPCKFIPHGKRELLLEKYGLSAKAIADKIQSVICPK